MNSSGGFAVAIATVVLTLAAPLLYVASVGPAIALAERGVISDDENSPASKFYFPLRFAHENCEPIGQVLDCYTSFWE